MFVLWLGLVLGSFYTFFKLISSYLSQSHEKYWKNLGIFPGTVDVSFYDRVTERKTFTDIEMEMYQKIKNAGREFVGLTEFGSRVLFVVDPDIMKAIMVKDGDIWMDRRDLNMHKDPILGKMLLFMQGAEWKAARSLLSPNFSTGKIKRMFERIEDCSKMLVDNLSEKMGQNGSLEVEMRDVSSSYTMDVIVSTFFGIEAGTIKDRDSVFAQMGRRMQAQTPIRMFQFIMSIGFPKLAQKLKIRFFESESTEFFYKIVKQTIAYREANGVRRQDFLQLLIDYKNEELKKNGPVELTDESIAASSVLFLLGGFDTVEGLLSFATYLMAIHPDLQEKMAKEVQQVMSRYEGKLTYEGINELEFLDRFVNETLRLYPAFIRTERKSIADYKIPGTDIILPKNSLAAFSIYALQVDPEIYPEPFKFDPDRWTNSEKEKRNPFSYLAFGAGPRNCIGMRFALIESKAILANLAVNFKIEPSEKLHIPLQVTVQTGGVKPKTGVYLKLTKRN